MVSINIQYSGGLHCEAEHEPSGTILTTDAPVDNQGKGESFSPTDLIATGLGSCILTTMGIVATKIGADIDGARANVTKEMAKTPPRRIAALQTIVYMPEGVAAEHRGPLEQAARHCPVHQSLHQDISAPISFIWP